jgi:hypothetical protein
MDEALDQLFRYAVWCDTKTAVLLFIRKMDVSAVIGKALNVIKLRENFVREAPETPASRYSFVMHATGDLQQKIRMAFMPFALRAKSAAREGVGTPEARLDPPVDPVIAAEHQMPELALVDLEQGIWVGRRYADVGPAAAASEVLTGADLAPSDPVGQAAALLQAAPGGLADVADDRARDPAQLSRHFALEVLVGGLSQVPGELAMKTTKSSSLVASASL